VKKTSTHIYFWDSIYSNWHMCNFTLDGIEFNCAEQYLMYSKAKLFGDERIAKIILFEKHPRDQKKLGRMVSNFDKDIWDKNCFEIMVKGLVAKFSQNDDLLKQMLETENRIFVEGSPYDTIWGVGLHFEDSLILDESNWKGSNLLGKALVETRNILRGINSNEI